MLASRTRRLLLLASLMGAGALVAASPWSARPVEAQPKTSARLALEGTGLPALAVLRFDGPKRTRVQSDGETAKSKSGIMLRQAQPATETLGPMTVTVLANAGPALSQWYQSATANWGQAARNLTLTQYDGKGGVVARWNVVQARPVELSLGITGEAGDPTETVVFVVEEFARVL